MNKHTFKEDAEELIEKFQKLIDRMPDRGDSSSESQKVCLQISLNDLDATVNGVEDSDFDNEHEHLTKKEFKERCYFTEYGRGDSKQNAIFFGYKQDENSHFLGYKYMVKSSPYQFTKKELFDMLYDWVMKEKQPHWLVTIRYARTDADRFKVPVSG